MTPNQVQKLKHGLYIIHWKAGGISLAAVGSKENGDRWLACTNWVTTTENSENGRNTAVWGRVAKVGLICASRY